MNNHIIESIGSWGIITTPARVRLNLVRPGDIIEAPENFRAYPIAHRYSRIASISADGIAHICEGMGSAFLLKDGSCDISGGPWWSMPTTLLEPTHELYEATYWNWGDNSPGAGQGVYYHISRPVHRLTIHPYDLKQRYGVTEPLARKGSFNHEEPLAETDWSLFLKGKEVSDGEFLWVFRKSPLTVTANDLVNA
jgi:hypothetical protein